MNCYVNLTDIQIVSVFWSINDLYYMLPMLPTNYTPSLKGLTIESADTGLNGFTFQCIYRLEPDEGSRYYYSDKALLHVEAFSHRSKFVHSESSRQKACWRLIETVSRNYSMAFILALL